LGANSVEDLLSVDRTVDRPTVKNMTVGAAGRPHPTLDLSVDRPVDGGQIQRAKLSSRSTARSTGARSRELTLWITRPPALSVLKPKGRACICAHRSTVLLTDFSLGRPAEGQVRKF